jgi:hypothetical protein
MKREIKISGKILKNIKFRRESKGIPVELLRKYLKNANLPNPWENIKTTTLKE